VILKKINLSVNYPEVSANYKKKNQKQVTKNVRFNYHQTLKMHLSKTITFKKC